MLLCAALVFSWCTLLVPTRGQNELDIETIHRTLLENQKTMLEIRKEMHAMRDEAVDLKHHLAEGRQNTKEMQAMRDEVVGLKHQLTQVIQLGNRERDRLEALNYEKTNTNIEMQHDMRKLESELHKQKSKMVALEEKMKLIRPDLQEYEPVGFTAHATDVRLYQFGETILFDDVQSNLGDHYNATTCTFTCPHHGVYQFSVHFNAYSDDYMYIEIVRNDTVLARAMADNHPHIYINSHTSALVIVECELGQEVWARSGYDGGNMNGVIRYSQFTGFLLQRYA